MLDTRTATAVTARSWEAMLTALGALPEPDWSRPTRCAGWTIRDLVGHCVWGVSMEADALRRARSGQGGRAEGLAATTPDGRPLTDTQLVEALSEAVTDLLFELSISTAEDEALDVPLAAADVSWPLAMSIFAFESAVHADDLAAALDPAGPRLDLDPDAVRGSVAFLAWFLPLMVPAADPPAVGTVVRFAGDGGAAYLALAWDGAAWRVTTDAAASAGYTIAGSDSDVLRVALGRLSPYDPELRIAGDAVAAGLVKVWLPGP